LFLDPVMRTLTLMKSSYYQIKQLLQMPREDIC